MAPDTMPTSTIEHLQARNAAVVENAAYLLRDYAGPAISLDFWRGLVAHPVDRANGVRTVFEVPELRTAAHEHQRAIEFALSLDDHFGRRQFLNDYLHGSLDPEEWADFLGGATQAGQSS